MTRKYPTTEQAERRFLDDILRAEQIGGSVTNAIGEIEFKRRLDLADRKLALAESLVADARRILNTKL